MNTEYRIHMNALIHLHELEGMDNVSAVVFEVCLAMWNLGRSPTIIGLPLQCRALQKNPRPAFGNIWLHGILHHAVPGLLQVGSTVELCLP